MRWTSHEKLARLNPFQYLNTQLTENWAIMGKIAAASLPHFAVTRIHKTTHMLSHTTSLTFPFQSPVFCIKRKLFQINKFCLNSVTIRFVFYLTRWPFCR